MYAKSTKTIARILEAARVLFVAKNFNEVTMSEIAETAEVTKGALYHHFSSKEELYLKMMYNYLEEIGTLAQNAVEAMGSSRERLRDLAVSFLQLSPQEQNLIKLVRRDINVFTEPDRSGLVRAYQQALPEKAEAIVGDGIRDGEIEDSDARILAWQHVAMVEVVLSAYARDALGDPEDTADFVTRLFFDGASRNGSAPTD